tara:strand:+ start:353 stop:667 length:315 start_codon:yes stop_codon:yes gene_type:complete
MIYEGVDTTILGSDVTSAPQYFFEAGRNGVLRLIFFTNGEYVQPAQVNNNEDFALLTIGYRSKTIKININEDTVIDDLYIWKNEQVGIRVSCPNKFGVYGVLKY